MHCFLFLISCNKRDQPVINYESETLDQKLNTRSSGTCDCTLDWTVENIPDITGDVCSEIAVSHEAFNDCDCDITNVNYFARRTNYLNNSAEEKLEIANVAQDNQGNYIGDASQSSSTPFKVITDEFSTVTSNNLLYLDGYDIVIAGDINNQYIEVCIQLGTENCQDSCNPFIECKFLLTNCE